MPKSSQKIGEVNFKTAVFQECFGTRKFAYMKEFDLIEFIIIGNTDCYLLWAETKKNTADTVEIFVQLLLIMGKIRTFARFHHLPSLIVFNNQKITRIETYHLLNKLRRYFN
jgi:hypothetical protein